MKKRNSVIGMTFLCLLCTSIMGINALHGKAAESEELINKGVSIGDVNVSTMTAKEAKKAVNEYIKTLGKAKVTIQIEGQEITSTASKLGFVWKDKSAVDAAVGLAKNGNIIKRYTEKKDLEQENQDLPLVLGFNEKKAKAALEELCSEYNHPAVEATLTRSNGEFVITDEVDGKILNAEECIQAMTDVVTDNWQGTDFEVELTTMTDKAAVTAEDCRKVKDELGSFTTRFTTGYSNANRNQNIRNGAEKLGDKVIAPGEEFSCNALLEPWTEENGWADAGTYVDGRVEDSLGGGICQVSSTLYNAVLLSELEVTERYPHSMAVGYVDLSADAALAGTYKDLKFKNNTDAPIYIHSVYEEGSITFTIFGHETRDENRTIKYESEKLSETPPEEVTSKVDSMKKGERVTTTQGHTGYTARLWKYVYVDGKEVSKEIVNNSSYKSSPNYVNVGTGKDEKTSKKNKDKTTEKKTTTKKDETTTKERETKTKKEETTTRQSETTTKAPETTTQVPTETEPEPTSNSEPSSAENEG